VKRRGIWILRELERGKKKRVAYDNVKEK